MVLEERTNDTGLDQMLKLKLMATAVAAVFLVGAVVPAFSVVRHRSKPCTQEHEKMLDLLVTKKWFQRRTSIILIRTFDCNRASSKITKEGS